MNKETKMTIVKSVFIVLTDTKAYVYKYKEELNEKTSK